MDDIVQSYARFVSDMHQIKTEVDWAVRIASTVVDEVDIANVAVAAAAQGAATLLKIILLTGLRDDQIDRVVKATKSGLDVLKIVHQLIKNETGLNMFMRRRAVVDAASGGGHLEVLQWLRAHSLAEGGPYPWNSDTCYRAARNGHIEVLQWMRNENPPCPWDWRTCQGAAWGGHLEVLKWARANGCDWNAKTRRAAASKGYAEMLRWLRANGCP